MPPSRAENFLACHRKELQRRLDPGVGIHDLLCVVFSWLRGLFSCQLVDYLLIRLIPVRILSWNRSLQSIAVCRSTQISKFPRIAVNWVDRPFKVWPEAETQNTKPRDQVLSCILQSDFIFWMKTKSQMVQMSWMSPRPVLGCHNNVLPLFTTGIFYWG